MMPEGKDCSSTDVGGLERLVGRFVSLASEGLSGFHRLGILGGTFDPIHVGHLAMAEQAIDALGLDGVLFIPAGTPVFKKDQQVTPARHRFEMVRLAVAGNPRFDVSSLEIDRGGDTFTVDTLETLRGLFPANVELVFITGADAALTLHKWRRASDMAHLASFVGVARPGYTLDEAAALAVRDACGIEVRFLQLPGLDVSSSMLREKLTAGQSVRYLVPDVVTCYLQSTGLYR